MIATVDERLSLVAQTNLARLLTNSGRREEARTLLEDVLVHDDEEHRAWAKLYLASLEMDENNLAAAEKLLREVLEVRRSDLSFSAREHLAYLLFKRRPKEAIPLLEGLLRECNEARRAGLLMLLGHSFLAAGRVRNARKVFEEVRGSDDTALRVPALAILGLLAVYDGENEKAESFFHCVKDSGIEAAVQMAEFGHALVLIDEDRLDEADTVLSDFTARYPGSVGANVGLSLLRLMQERNDEAIALVVSVLASGDILEIAYLRRGLQKLRRRVRVFGVIDSLLDRVGDGSDP